MNLGFRFGTIAAVGTMTLAAITCRLLEPEPATIGTAERHASLFHDGGYVFKNTYDRTDDERDLPSVRFQLGGGEAFSLPALSQQLVLAKGYAVEGFQICLDLANGKCGSIVMKLGGDAGWVLVQ
jgi:hypothetical protein